MPAIKNLVFYNYTGNPFAIPNTAGWCGYISITRTSDGRSEFGVFDVAGYTHISGITGLVSKANWGELTVATGTRYVVIHEE